MPFLSLRHARGATGRRQRRGPLLAQRRRAVRLAAARRLRTGLRPLRPRDAARAACAPRRAGRQCRAESGARRVTDGAVTRRGVLSSGTLRVRAAAVSISLYSLDYTKAVDTKTPTINITPDCSAEGAQGRSRLRQARFLGFTYSCSCNLQVPHGSLGCREGGYSSNFDRQPSRHTSRVITHAKSARNISLCSNLQSHVHRHGFSNMDLHWHVHRHMQMSPVRIFPPQVAPNDAIPIPSWIASSPRPAVGAHAGLGSADDGA